MVATDPSDTYDMVSISTRNEYLEFKVAACKKAKVALFQELNPLDTSLFYEVGIGFSDNTQIFLSDSERGERVLDLTFVVYIHLSDHFRYGPFSLQLTSLQPLSTCQINFKISTENKINKGGVWNLCLFLLSGGVVAEMTYPDALSCYIERPFWVSWDSSILRVNLFR